MHLTGQSQAVRRVRQLFGQRFENLKRYRQQSLRILFRATGPKTVDACIVWLSGLRNDVAGFGVNRECRDRRCPQVQAQRERHWSSVCKSTIAREIGVEPPILPEERVAAESVQTHWCIP